MKFILLFQIIKLWIYVFVIFVQELYNSHVVLGCFQLFINSVVHYSLQLIISSLRVHILLFTRCSDIISSTIERAMSEKGTCRGLCAFDELHIAFSHISHSPIFWNWVKIYSFQDHLCTMGSEDNLKIAINPWFNTNSRQSSKT